MKKPLTETPSPSPSPYGRLTPSVLPLLTWKVPLLVTAVWVLAVVTSWSVAAGPPESGAVATGVGVEFVKDAESAATG